MTPKYGYNSPWRNRRDVSALDFISQLSSLDLDEAVAQAMNFAPTRHVIVNHCKKCKADLRTGKDKDSLCDPCANAEADVKEQKVLIREDSQTIPILTRTPMEPTAKEFIARFNKEKRKLEEVFFI